MKKDPKTPKRIEPERVQHDQITNAMKNVVLLKDKTIDTKIQEASKPMYLTRYE